MLQGRMATATEAEKGGAEPSSWRLLLVPARRYRLSLQVPQTQGGARIVSMMGQGELWCVLGKWLKRDLRKLSFFRCGSWSWQVELEP